jgi:hypothetical protein
LHFVMPHMSDLDIQQMHLLLRLVYQHLNQT